MASFEPVSGYLYFFCFTGLVLAASAQDCSLFEATECPHYDVVNKGFFKILPLENTESTCRSARIALDCILVEKYTRNCGPTTSMVPTFNGRNSAMKSMCEDYKYAFEKSKTCFSNADLKMDLAECLDEHYEEPCAFEYTKECVVNYLADYETCDDSDAALMVYLVGQFLKPYDLARNCDWEDPSVDGIPKAVTTRETTVMTTSMTNGVTNATITTRDASTTDASKARAGKTRGGRENGTVRCNASTGLICLLFIAKFVVATLKSQF